MFIISLSMSERDETCGSVFLKVQDDQISCFITGGFNFRKLDFSVLIRSIDCCITQTSVISIMFMSCLYVCYDSFTRPSHTEDL